MEKTLLGKEGWLFLKNDAARELEVHCHNLCLPNELVQRKRYDGIENYCLTIFPNKSYLYGAYLPEGYIAKYRPGFDVYKNIFHDRIVDGYAILQDEIETFYKTDTHMNFKGGYLIYCEWVHHVNHLFSLQIPIQKLSIIRKPVPALSELGVGIGDLTWPTNCGSLKIEDTSDLYFYPESPVTVSSPYMNYKITDGRIRLLTYSLEDTTQLYHDKILDWNILSTCMLYIKNDKCVDRRILIFYDSFLLSTMSLYMNIFNETYMAKHTYDPALVDLIKPDFVFEFRVERFLL